MNILIVFGLLIPFTLFAQLDMSVNKKAGGSDDLKIVNSNQITFQSATANDVMYVKKKDGTTDVYKLSDINSIIFDGITGVEDYIAVLFNLENYPNPFYQNTTITFTLEKCSKVELTIFDINGNLIKSLLNDFFETGKHIADWDGTNSDGTIAVAGNYYYQLKVDNEIITKNMIFIK